MWKWSDNAGLKVGKDYSPVTDFISNQWFDADNDLLGTGNFYGRRPAGVTLILGDFELAALVPSYGADLNTTANGVNGATGNTDPDSYIPRFEAAYDAEARRGLHQALRRLPVLHGQAGHASTSRDRRPRRVVPVLGVSTSWNIGAFSIGGQLSYGMNEGNVQGWTTGYNSRASSSAYLKGGDDIADVYTLQALIVPGHQVHGHPAL